MTKTIDSKFTVDRHHDGYELPLHELQEICRVPPIDRDRFLEQCMNNEEFAQGLLDEFARTAQSRLDSFCSALDTKNGDMLASKAHALKGVAGILCADHLVTICEQLESSARDTDWSQVGLFVQELCQEVLKVIEAIPQKNPANSANLV